MTEEQLIEIISNNLPITDEDTILFIKGVQSDYLSPSLDAVIALAYRDKIINQLEKDNKYLRMKLEYELQRKIREWEKANEKRN